MHITNANSKRIRKLLSFILTTCIAVSMMTGVTAENAVTELPNTETEQQLALPISQGESVVKIVSEDTSKRGAFEKHFICEDGSYIAATYPYAVHEKDENNEWIDIDNSLALEYNRIKNNSKALPISFAQTAASSDKLAEMEINGRKISWSLTATSKLNASELQQLGTDILQSKAALSDYSPIAAQEYVHALNPNAVAEIGAEKEVSAPQTVEELNQEKMTPANLTSTLAYKNAVGEGVDIKYTVLPDKIKEDIILNKPSNFTGYTMHINANGLTAVKRADNSVDFLDEDGEVIFTVYAPYMYDSADELSQDITVDLSLQGDTYALTVTPDAAWLNSPDRAYPIVIDPDISTDRTRTNIVDNYVMQGEGVQDRNLDRLYIGLKSGKIVRTYIKYKTMPTIPSNALIHAATQRLNLVVSTKTANNANAYLVTGGDWESSTIEWSNMPTAYLPIDSNISHNNKSYYSFNCLPAVRYWYSGSGRNNGTNGNFGFMMAYHDETIDDYNAFYSADCTTTSRRPQLTINYTIDYSNATIVWPMLEYNGLNSRWGYRTYNNKMHYGIDIQGLDENDQNPGTVLAAIDGTIRTCDYSTAGQGLIITQHGSDFQTRYYHLNTRYITSGSVTAGTQIGIAGDSGNAKKVHLHFQLQWSDEKNNSYNPLEIYHRDDKRYGWTNPNPMFIKVDGIYVPNENFDFSYSHSDYNDTDATVWKK